MIRAKRKKSFIFLKRFPGVLLGFKIFFGERLARTRKKWKMFLGATKSELLTFSNTFSFDEFFSVIGNESTHGYCVLNIVLCCNEPLEKMWR